MLKWKYFLKLCDSLFLVVEWQKLVISFIVMFITSPNSQYLDGKSFLFLAQTLDVVSTVSYSQMQIDSIEQSDLGIWNIFCLQWAYWNKQEIFILRPKKIWALLLTDAGNIVTKDMEKVLNCFDASVVFYW